MAKTLLYLILLLFTVGLHAESNYEQALKTGVYVFNANEFKVFEDKPPFSKLNLDKKKHGLGRRSQFDTASAWVQGSMAQTLYQVGYSKKITQAIYESNLFKYSATFEGSAVSVTTIYKSNNQIHSKILFYPKVGASLEKNQIIKTYWPSGKLQSQEYYCSGQPVGYEKHFEENGKLYGVIDWTSSDYEPQLNKLYKTLNDTQYLLLSGDIYLAQGNSMIFSDTIPNKNGVIFKPQTSGEGDAVPFWDIYQRHKLGMTYKHPIDKNTESILRCPWLDEAMSYPNENPQFTLPTPKPITVEDIKNNNRNKYENCVFNPSVECLSHFAFEQTKNDSNANSFYRARRIFTALEKKDELNQVLQIMRERGINPSQLDFEKYVNKQSNLFKTIRKQAEAEVKKAEVAKDNVALIKALRQPIYIEPLNIDLSEVDEIGGYGADRQVYLMALAATAEVYADKNQSNKAKELLSILELNMPKKKLKGTDSDRQIINNIRAEMAISYSRLGRADLAKAQLAQIEYSEQPIIHGTYFSAYGWVNSALQLCRQGDVQNGVDFLSTGISMQKNSRLQIVETLKLALNECKYPFNLTKVVGRDFNNPYARVVFDGFPQMWLSYELFYKANLPIQPIDLIEKQRKESEAKNGTNKGWIYQNYYSQKINTLFASGHIAEAKEVADEYERFVQAGSWYKFAPTTYTKVGRLRAKYGDCKGALSSFSNAVKSLQLIKMNVDSSFVIRHPHYTVLPLIAQGMAYCGASVDDIQKLKIDFDYSAPAETIQNNRRADALEIEIAIKNTSGDVKSTAELVSKLAPTDLKINALVTIAKQSPKNTAANKSTLIKELNSREQYFVMQHGAKEQRRAIGGFLEVLDLYFEPQDKQLPTYLNDLAKYAEIIPQAQFKARAMCHLGYLADKKQVTLNKDYFNLGTKISKDLSWAYGAPAGSCAYWLKKAGRSNDAESLLDSNMATFRAYKTDPNNPNNWRKYAEGSDLANAALVYWEYEHGEIPSKHDEIMNYYQDSTGLIEAY